MEPSIFVFESRAVNPLIHLNCTTCLKTVEISFPYNDIKEYNQDQISVKCYNCSTHFTTKTSKLKLFNVPKKPNTTSQPKKSSLFGEKTGTDENPIEQEYYTLLCVDPKATPAQIKKSYYVMAMKYHPDKNDDPKAEESFKKISEAYQVLSDPDKRSFYNRHGKQARSDGSFVNPEEFFKQQFGGDKMIGEISIARDFKDAMNSMGGQSDGKEQESLTIEQRMEIRNERVSKLSINLSEKLSLYTDAFPQFDKESEPPIGTTVDQIKGEAMESFKSIAKLEVESLKNESHGADLLKAIGYTYILKSQQSLAKLDLEDGNVLKKAWGFGSRLTGIMREKAHIVSETVGTLRTAVQLQNSFKQLKEMEDKKEKEKKEKGLNDDDELQLSQEESELKLKLETEAATQGLEALWRGSKLEVESVLREVCERVLEDVSLVNETKRRRAEALLELGNVYQNC